MVSFSLVVDFLVQVYSEFLNLFIYIKVDNIVINVCYDIYNIYNILHRK